MITAIAWANLTAIFGVELAGLTAFGLWGALAVSPAPGRPRAAGSSIRLTASNPADGIRWMRRDEVG